MHKKDETITLGWIDNGSTDGKFTEGLMHTVLEKTNSKNVKIHNFLRVQGNQIGRQRQVLFDAWANELKTDWLLWVDSDIVLTQEALIKIWEFADKDNVPVISGVYFVSVENEQTMMMPMPCIFIDKEDYKLECIHPLPEDKLVPIDCSGMGFILMHKSIISKLKTKYPKESLFAEENGIGDKFISEDVMFFRKLRSVGVKSYAHTGAIVQHMKRFSFDKNFYGVYWEALHRVEQENKNL